MPTIAARIPIAVAALVRDGLVLLAHRHPSRRNYPDCWDLVGGHVEPSELPDRAVVRECLEELGVHILDPVPIPMTVTDSNLEIHAFLVTRWSGEPVNAAPQENDDLRWFRPDELAGLHLAHPASLSSILSAFQENSVAVLSYRRDAVRGESGSGHRDRANQGELR